jgi:hypothetical protein
MHLDPTWRDRTLAANRRKATDPVWLANVTAANRRTAAKRRAAKDLLVWNDE